MLPFSFSRRLCRFGAFAAILITTLSLPAETVRVLSIGNSFSQNATRYLNDIVKAAGDELIHRPIVVGGASLELHWTKAEKNQQNTEDKEGRYSNGRSLKDELLAERWDFVTIQQASIKSHDATTYRPFAAQLAGLIRADAPQAKLLMHQTWEYRRDDPRFTQANPAPGEPNSADAMYEGLAEAYAIIAREIGADLIPSGRAFHLANNDPTWAFQSPSTPVNPAAFQAPVLPTQERSLYVGWNWRKQPDGTTTLAYDGRHANLAGEYLGACVWYEILFKRSAQGNSFVPEGLDPTFAKFLQDTAHRAVVELQSSPSTAKISREE